VAAVFTAAAAVHTAEALDLTTSLRSHLAEDVQTWITQLLGGNLGKAAGSADVITRQGFDLYMTGDLQLATDYVKERYANEIDKRYGILASSKAKNLEVYGVRNGFNFTRRLKEGPWYNDPPGSKYSCCQLHDVATEFACQGLELDFPIVAWGSDFTWTGKKWSSPTQGRSKARDPHKLRMNSYRVLLSRGRDGMIIFIPPTAQMDATRQALASAGVRDLEISSQRS
jgi:DUF2075 family protein